MNLSPQLIDEYSELADGTNLVYHNQVEGCDKNGFHNEKIVYANCRLIGKEANQVRIVTNDSELFSAYKIVMNPSEAPDELMFYGFLLGVSSEKALAAEPGSEYAGWKRSKCYRLTVEQISDLVKDKIFIYNNTLHYILQ